MGASLTRHVSRLAAAVTKTRKREATAVVVAALLLLALQALRVERLTIGHPLFAEPGWDHHAYRAMAQGNPFDFHLAPFGWRPLVPLLAKLSPAPLQGSFFVLTLAGLAVAASATYATVAADRGRQAGVVALLCLFSLTWAVKFPLQDFWLPDAVAFAALALATLAVVRKSDRGLLAALTIGVFAKEVVIFAAVLRYTLRAHRPVDLRSAKETVLVALPAVVVLLALRVGIGAQNGDAAYVAGLSPTLREFASYIPSYHYLDLLRDIGADRLQDTRRDTLLAYTTGTWGVPILALVAIGAAARPLLALRLAPFLVLVYAQLLFALNIERLLVAGFPAVVWLAAEGARAVATAFRVPVAAFIPIPAALILLRLRDPANLFTGFEIETFVLIGGLAVPALWATLANRREASP
ncbi:MAG: hypothetical protein ACKVVT_10185 [Dehalococcoidia bacterium]